MGAEPVATVAGLFEHQYLSCSVAPMCFSLFCVAAPLKMVTKMVFPKKGSLFFLQGHGTTEVCFAARASDGRDQGIHQQGGVQVACVSVFVVFPPNLASGRLFVSFVFLATNLGDTSCSNGHLEQAIYWRPTFLSP